MELEKEIKAIHKKVDGLLGKIDPPHLNRLMTQKQIREELGYKLGDKSWRATRAILISDYGMSHIPGVGMKITRRNFEKFLSEYYGIHKNK